MKYSEIERILRKAGCRLIGHGANHDWWYSPVTGRRFQVSRHKSEEAKPKTVKSLSEQSGVKI